MDDIQELNKRLLINQKGEVNSQAVGLKVEDSKVEQQNLKGRNNVVIIEGTNRFWW